MKKLLPIGIPLILFLVILQIQNVQANNYVDKFNQSILGENTYVFDPQMDMNEVQILLDTIYNRQQGRKAEFSHNRYALFFKPGTYHLDVKVGFYMQVYGLGNTPDDVKIVGAVRSKTFMKQGNVLTNFWRSIENLSILPTIDSANIWGVSQAAPLRRIHVLGDLQLHDGGYASGGFLANSKIDGKIDAGQQQQWFTRNSEIGSWVGGAWNIMFMGVPNSPVENWPAKPFTVIKETPEIREKPYVVFEKEKYYLKVPEIKKNSIGSDFQSSAQKTKSFPLNDFYIVKPQTDNSKTINRALQAGKNLLFTPGIYQIDESLKINRSGTIIYGLGLATLQSTNGNVIIEISDVENVIVSNLMLDAGLQKSETLFRVGTQGLSDKKNSKASFLYDIYARVGGPHEGSTESCIIINSKNVFVANAWLWRADHGNGVGWDKNRCANGLIVNGDNVTIYGLFNEHFQEYQTVWNGENGKVYFYQSEMPYDSPTVDAWKHDGVGGYASYKVSEKVKTHQAWGVGVYCVFYKAPIVVDNAIETPETIEKYIHHAFTYWLSGNKESSIKSILNGRGNTVNEFNRKAVLD